MGKHLDGIEGGSPRGKANSGSRSRLTNEGAGVQVRRRRPTPVGGRVFCTPQTTIPVRTVASGAPSRLSFEGGDDPEVSLAFP
jgi:hypothetical protein